MTTSLIDRKGIATAASTEGFAALARGDTAHSRQKYAEAGAVLELESKNARKSAEKHLLLFLAATMYYRGGDYSQALRLARKIERRLLPRDTQAAFDRFRMDVDERADRNYRKTVHDRLVAYFRAGKPKLMLETLQDHPYLMPPSQMAFVRAVCCEQLGDYKAAALFFGDAHRWNPGDVDLIYQAAATPLTLLSAGQARDAWDYVSCQLQLIPHAFTFVTASLVRFRQALQAEVPDDRITMYREQAALARQAIAEFRKLPPEQQRRTDFRRYMLIGAQSAALGLRAAGKQEAAIQFLDDAVGIDPTASGPRAMRGVFNYSKPDAITDFREALRLGESNYAPYYFLAHASLENHDYAGAEELLDAGLIKTMPATIRSQFFEWKAIAKGNQEADEAAVMALFEKAKQVDPDNSTVAHNIAVYQTRARQQHNMPRLAWNQSLRLETITTFVTEASLGQQGEIQRDLVQAAHAIRWRYTSPHATATVGAKQGDRAIHAQVVQ